MANHSNTDREVVTTLNTTKIAVFNAIKELGEATFATAKQHVGKCNRTVRRHLAGLQEEGLVECYQYEEGGNTIYWALTPAGKKLKPESRLPKDGIDPKC